MKRLLVLTALPLLAGGCGGSSASSEGSLQVAAGFYPLEYVAARVAGDLAEVDNLTQPGAEPHDLELSVQATARVAEADLVLHLAGFQPAVDDAVSANATGAVLDAAEEVSLRPVGPATADADDHGDDADEEHPDEEHTDEEHTDADPHFWQDPLLMADFGDAVAAELAAADPDHAEDYRANAQALRQDLQKLDTEYADGLASCERTTVVVSHDAFGYLEKYGLTMEPIAGLAPDAEPTAADLQRLQRLIRAEGITTVFSETLVSPQMSETLAADVGVEADVLDPVEGLSDESSSEDYLSLMRANLTALQEANGC